MASNTPPAILDYTFINFRGYGPDRKDSFAALCGDDPPTIQGGYAKWAVVDRPLMRGVTVFQGYDPMKMTVSIRFGVWDNKGWHVDNEPTGKYVEEQIEILEWMAGANFTAGASPYVYLNTYDPNGATTNLIPYEYQTTAGVTGSLADANLWPWIIGDGIQWGQSYRATTGNWKGAGNRVYQEAKITLTNFQGLSKPPQQSAKGKYFTTSRARDTMLLVAGAPEFHALDVQTLAQSIQGSSKNNPIPGSKIRLKSHHLNWHIGVGKSVWVPSHNT